MNIRTKLITAEEFEQVTVNKPWTALIRGEIRQMTPAGAQHGEIALRVGARLLLFVEQHGLGKAFAAKTGFILSRNPDTVRAPDAAFVSHDRAAQQRRPEGYFEGAPDLAIEVNSPGDSDDEVKAKVLDYLNAGTRLIWVLSPRTQTVTVYRSLSDIEVLTADAVLDGGEVLPGFSVRVSELFGR